MRLALSLIDYEPKIAAAVEFAFGGTLVALDLATAKLVTYHPQVMRPSVTMEGDQVSNEGTLTGGMRASFFIIYPVHCTAFIFGDPITTKHIFNSF